MSSRRFHSLADAHSSSFLPWFRQRKPTRTCRSDHCFAVPQYTRARLPSLTRWHTASAASAAAPAGTKIQTEKTKESTAVSTFIDIPCRKLIQVGRRVGCDGGEFV